MLLLTLLFFAVSIGFTIFYFLKKSLVFAIIGGAVWFLFAMYEYSNSSTWDIYRGFALLGGLLTVLSWTIPLTWREGSGEVEEEVEEDYIDSINKRRQQLRDRVNKSRGGGSE